MMKNAIIQGIFTCLLLSLTHSCVKLDTLPHDSASDLDFWEKSTSAEEAVNTCYIYLTNPNELFYNDAMSDNAYASKPAESYPQAIANGTFTPTHGYVQGVWAGRYAGIRLSNKLLDNIDKVPGLTDRMRNQYIGEAKVLRAISYYELMIRFGDIPYFTHAITIPESQALTRTPRAKVLEYIIAELDDVLGNDMLPASYGGGNVGRITKWGAMAFKARVLLSQNMWPELEAVTRKIIDESGHDLFPSYEGLFDVDNESNAEILIDIQYVAKLRDYDVGSHMMPPTMKGYCQLAPLQSLIDDYIMLNGKHMDEAGSGWTLATQFENRDPRLKSSVIYNGNSYPGGDPINTVSGTDGAFGVEGTSPTGYYTRKYYDKYLVPGVTNSGLNVIYLRYADVLLMHAEALAEQYKLTEDEWDRTIRRLRVRAGFTDPGALDFPGTRADLIEIVRRERRCELAFEGLRYTDIVRWRIGDKVLNGKALGAQTTKQGVATENGYFVVETRVFDKKKHYLWPVPEAERLLNKKLGQNPRW